jgi:hypothetical protein
MGGETGKHDCDREPNGLWINEPWSENTLALICEINRNFQRLSLRGRPTRTNRVRCCSFEMAKEEDSGRISVCAVRRRRQRFSFGRLHTFLRGPQNARHMLCIWVTQSINAFLQLIDIIPSVKHRRITSPKKCTLPVVSVRRTISLRIPSTDQKIEIKPFSVSVLCLI